MKKLFATAMLAASLALAGCGTTSNTGDTVAQVQAIAKQVCGFLPTATTVLNIISGGNSYVQTAESVASAICSAVTSKAALRGAVPTVNGVKVRGRFVLR